MQPVLSNLSTARGRQGGAVTLVITMLILVAVALGVYSMVGTTSIESRMTANDKRGRQAMQAAQQQAIEQSHQQEQSCLLLRTTQHFGPVQCGAEVRTM